MTESSAEIFNRLEKDVAADRSSRAREAFQVEPRAVLPELIGRGIPVGHIALRGDFD